MPATPRARPRRHVCHSITATAALPTLLQYPPHCHSLFCSDGCTQHWRALFVPHRRRHHRMVASAPFCHAARTRRPLTGAPQRFPSTRAARITVLRTADAAFLPVNNHAATTSYSSFFLCRAALPRLPLQNRTHNAPAAAALACLLLSRKQHSPLCHLNIFLLLTSQRCLLPPFLSTCLPAVPTPNAHHTMPAPPAHATTPSRFTCTARLCAHACRAAAPHLPASPILPSLSPPPSSPSSTHLPLPRARTRHTTHLPPCCAGFIPRCRPAHRHAARAACLPHNSTTFSTGVCG